MPNQQHSNNKKFYIQTKTNKITKKERNKQNVCPYPQNLNGTLSPMWQEIQWDEEPKCAKAKVSLELEHQNTCQKTNSNLFLKEQTSKG